MAIPSYIHLKTIRLRGHPELNEKWIHDRIAEDPAVLGLGDLNLLERCQTEVLHWSLRQY
jgi:hypothetical protein